jgi:hypothetical protein
VSNCVTATQGELPGIPCSHSLPALRERELRLEREVADMRHTFKVCGFIEAGFLELAVQLSEVKKQIAEVMARGGLTTN